MSSNTDSRSYLLNASMDNNINNNYESLNNNDSEVTDVASGEKNRNVEDKELLSSLKIVALCATWFALGVWIYIFIVQMIPTLPVMQGSPGAYPAGPNGTSTPITPVKECPSAKSKAGGTLGALYAYGALVSMVVAPTAGLLSDKTKTRYGRRYPFVIGGFVGVTIFVWGVPYGDETVLFLCFAIVQAFFSLSMSAYNGLVADVVPDAQRGLVSGTLGSATALGNLFGAGMGLLDLENGIVTGLTHLLLFICLAFSMYFLPEKGEWVLNGGREGSSSRDPIFNSLDISDGRTSPTELFNSIQNSGEETLNTPVANDKGSRNYDPKDNSEDTNQESLLDRSGENFNIHQAVYHASENTKNAYKGIKSFLKPLTDRDFLLVVLARFLVQMGIYTVQEFLLWYIACTIKLPSSGVCTSAKCALNLVLAPLIACSILSATISGYLSDRFGGRRKIIVYGSTSIMTSICIVFAFSREWNVSPVLGAIFGFGYGALLSIDYALALDAAPSEDEAAKDLGVWNLALVLPLTVAAPLGGWLLDHFNNMYQEIWVKPCFAGVGSSCNGYVVLFILSGLYLVGATIAVWGTSKKIK
jgi:MFS family permease